MEDAELDALRRKKMQELQQQQSQVSMAQEQERQMEAQRQAIMRQVLTPEARDRLATVKMAFPDVARMVEDQLIRLASSGQIPKPIDEPTLKQILRRVAPQKREINIERK
ncbi:MAG: DNA-binding protein [Methanomassiliicoccales archaeon]|jgi:programmed cell death protein 5|nr:DNA-binding protein [Euryarchaeota archaeon]